MKAKVLFNGLLSLAALAFVASLVYASGMPCDSDIPRCDTCSISAPCGNNGQVTGCERAMNWRVFHCNIKDGDCPNDPGKCNVMMMTTVSGYIMICSDGESGLCADVIGSSVTTNVQCTVESPCNPNEEVIWPGGDPVFGGDTGWYPWSIAPLEVPGS